MEPGAMKTLALQISDHIGVLNLSTLKISHLYESRILEVLLKSLLKYASEKVAKTAGKNGPSQLFALPMRGP